MYYIVYSNVVKRYCSFYWHPYNSDDLSSFYIDWNILIIK